MTEYPIHPGKDKYRELFEKHEGHVKVIKDKKVLVFNYTPCYKTNDDFCAVWNPDCTGESYQVSFKTLVRCLEQGIPVRI